MILPSTGERVKRDITLRDPNIFGNASNGQSSERTPLLPKTNDPPTLSRFHRLQVWTRDSIKQAYDFCKTTTAQAILKCSIAYLIATSFTFFTPVASILGTHQDGNQLIANVVVWFDPARTAGSMDLGILFAFLAFIYGSIIAFSAQAVAAMFEAAEMLVVGHVIDLLLFCWGGLGFLAWFKQYMGHPLVNTASSLASLAIVTCLTKEGVVQTGDFSYIRVAQILKMLVVGIIVSFGVNLLLWPNSARKSLRENLMKTTDCFGDLLTAITASFLAGAEEDLNHPAVIAASDKFKTAYNALPGQLADARYEHHPLGTESQYHIEKHLIECVQQLAQDLGGLRSAAETQFSLLAEMPSIDGRKCSIAQPLGSSDPTSSIIPAGQKLARDAQAPDQVLSPISEHRSSDNSDSTSEQGQEPHGTSHPALAKVASKSSVQTPSQIFDTFIQHLGPPMVRLRFYPSIKICTCYLWAFAIKMYIYSGIMLTVEQRSLAFTLREILRSLPYGAGSERTAGTLPKFRSSLTEALKLFNKSRKEALDLVYLSKELNEASSMHVAADFEEVAASCGHLSSSLEDFADNCLKYLDILDDLELDVNERPRGRSWTWLRFWRYRYSLEKKDFSSPDYPNPENGAALTAPNATLLNAAPTTSQEKPNPKLSFPYSLYPYLGWFRREDVKFAIKVGGGATFYAMFAFFPDVKPYYDHWHLEWGLVSYMLVCSMNIGASNTTAWSRSYGTLLGAVIAILVWLACQENPFALAFCGWVVSLVCFYFIVALNQGPMGRFILLTYNLSVLYAYGIAIGDPDAPNGKHDDGSRKTIFEVALHRCVAVLLGVFGGLIVTHYIWPISARTKVQRGLSLLWLRMGLIWKKAPLMLLIDGGSATPYYKDIRTENRLRGYLDMLDGYRKSAESEFRLRGPFATDSFDALFKSTSRMLDAFHALNVVISKDLKATPGELEILQYTATEREEVALRLSHMLSGKFDRLGDGAMCTNQKQSLRHH